MKLSNQPLFYQDLAIREIAGERNGNMNCPNCTTRMILYNDSNPDWYYECPECEETIDRDDVE